jgi:hypothetical protein
MEPTVIRIAPVQVTTWGSATDKDLTSWFAWYRKRGTPAALVQDTRRGSVEHSVSVWRYGKDSGERPDKWRESYEIINECHGFSGQAGIRKEER